ncbi:Putative phosphoslipid binding protein [Candidatus Koribacter versatilis Ellin345]|uniref:Phosphoslipid binding protein n=1 Tax=Koribacter versatilis (strain Ellin345) TaxID=204669 RepID=Q1IJM5_KORVE|nr:BON domain-containing protein [Candidatus Koribacter versatilis]ABF42925.1 Putative phosphoslipid binding protein [Candidatus Koribacter versatilis Ellin345]
MKRAFGLLLAALLSTAAFAQIKIDPVVPDVKAVASPSGDKNETRIAKEVRHELLMLPYYSIFDDLGFEVRGANVELNGAVNDGTLIKQAENAVKDIEGVGTVTNNIKLLTPFPDDVRIRREAYRKIFSTGGLSQYAWEAAPSIHIIVDRGRIRLIGYVNNQGDKDLANIAANGIPGVFGVTNELQVVNGKQSK